MTHVQDGDTIKVTGVPIRFAGLDCAELGSLKGDRAKRRMMTLAAGRRVECRLTGERSHDRHVGSCTLKGKNLSRTMIREGYCRRWW